MSETETIVAAIAEMLASLRAAALRRIALDTAAALLALVTPYAPLDAREPVTAAELRARTGRDEPPLPLP